MRQGHVSFEDEGLDPRRLELPPPDEGPVDADASSWAALTANLGRMDSLVHKLDQESLASARGRNADRDMPAMTRPWGADMDVACSAANLPPELVYAEPTAVNPAAAPQLGVPAGYGRDFGDVPYRGYHEQPPYPAQQYAAVPPDYGYAAEPVAAPQTIGGHQRHTYPPSPSLNDASERWDWAPSCQPKSPVSHGRRRFLFSDVETYDATSATPSTPSRQRPAAPPRSPEIGGDSCYPRSRSASASDRGPEGQLRRRPPFVGSFQAPPGPHAAPPGVGGGAPNWDEAEARYVAVDAPPASPRGQRRPHTPLSIPAGGACRSALANVGLGFTGMHLLDSSGPNAVDAGAYPDEAHYAGTRPLGNYAVGYSGEALPAVSCVPMPPRSRTASLDERRLRSPRLSARARESRSPREKRDVSVPRRFESARRMYGPERFHYDTSTYTGVWKHGGPSIMDKCGINMWSSLEEMVRPHLRRGGTFMSSQGDPLSKKCPSAFLLPMREEDRTRLEAEKMRRSSSSTQLLLWGPDRFYYDKSTYTGIHRFVPGGPREFEAGLAHQHPDQHDEAPPPSAAHVTNMAHVSSHLAQAPQPPGEWPPWPHEPIEGGLSGPPQPSGLPPFDSIGMARGTLEGSGHPVYDYGEQLSYRHARALA